MFGVLFSIGVCAQHADHSKKPVKENPATRVAGMGNHHHPVSTTTPRHRSFSNQWLSYVYAFNHDEAIRSFKRAAELDPLLAMAPLFGLIEALKAQKKDRAAMFVKREFDSAWKDADSPLRIEDLKR